MSDETTAAAPDTVRTRLLALLGRKFLLAAFIVLAATALRVADLLDQGRPADRLGLGPRHLRPGQRGPEGREEGVTMPAMLPWLMLPFWLDPWGLHA